MHCNGKDKPNSSAVLDFLFEQDMHTIRAIMILLYTDWKMSLPFLIGAIRFIRCYLVRDYKNGICNGKDHSKWITSAGFLSSLLFSF